MKQIDTPALTTEERSEISGNVMARTAINLLLDGKGPHKYIPVALCGYFADLYEEMLAAYQVEGIEGARLVFQQWAEEDPEVAELRAADPALQRRTAVHCTGDHPERAGRAGGATKDW
jgi:hypothetical protein